MWSFCFRSNTRKQIADLIFGMPLNLVPYNKRILTLYCYSIANALRLLGVSDHFLFRSGTCAFRVCLHPTLFRDGLSTRLSPSLVLPRKGFAKLTQLSPRYSYLGRQSYLPSKFFKSLSWAHVLCWIDAFDGNRTTSRVSLNFALKSPYISWAVSQSPPDCVNCVDDCLTVSWSLPKSPITRSVGLYLHQLVPTVSSALAPYEHCSSLYTFHLDSLGIALTGFHRIR